MSSGGERPRPPRDRHRPGTGCTKASGALAGQTFARITLPAIRWALSTVWCSASPARLGFGAVKVVSGGLDAGHRPRRARRGAYQQSVPRTPITAYTVSFILASIGGARIIVVTSFGPRKNANEHQDRRSQQVLRGLRRPSDIDLDIASGELTALLGPSGGGKSTLLRIIAGLERSDTGTVEIEGVDATQLPAQKRNVGFVFQHYAAFRHLTVAGNVAFGLKIRKHGKGKRSPPVDEFYDWLHLSQFADPLPSQLTAATQRLAWPGAGHRPTV